VPLVLSSRAFRPLPRTKIDPTFIIPFPFARSAPLQRPVDSFAKEALRKEFLPLTRKEILIAPLPLSSVLFLFNWYLHLSPHVCRLGLRAPRRGPTPTFALLRMRHLLYPGNNRGPPSRSQRFLSQLPSNCSPPSFQLRTFLFNFGDLIRSSAAAGPGFPSHCIGPSLLGALTPISFSHFVCPPSLHFDRLLSPASISGTLASSRRFPNAAF